MEDTARKSEGDDLEMQSAGRRGECFQKASLSPGTITGRMGASVPRDARPILNLFFAMLWVSSILLARRGFLG